MFDKKIKEVMTSPVACLTHVATVRDAAQKMRELDIGTVAVCENDQPIGIVTDRDVTVGCVALGHDSSTCKVTEIMSTGLVTCGPDDSIRDAEKLMEERQVRRLLVVDEAGKLRGLVALGDIAGVDRGMTGRILERVAQPAGFSKH